LSALQSSSSTERKVRAKAKRTKKAKPKKKLTAAEEKELADDEEKIRVDRLKLVADVPVHFRANEGTRVMKKGQTVQLLGKDRLFLHGFSAQPDKPKINKYAQLYRCRRGTLF
jgi:hypothetical protein